MMTGPNPEIAIVAETSPVWETIKERVGKTIRQEYSEEDFSKISERERKFVTAFSKTFQEAKKKAGTGKIMILSDFDLTLGYKDLETRKPVLRPSAISLLEYLKETEKNFEFYFFTDRQEGFLFSNLPEEIKKLLTEINGKDPKKEKFIFSVFDRGLEYRENDDLIYEAIENLKKSGVVAEANHSQLNDLKYNPDTLVKLVTLYEILKKLPDYGAFLVLEDLDYPHLLDHPEIVNLTVESDFIPLGFE